MTSPTGAAIHDILTVLKRRFPGLPVTLYPTAVQGEEAPAQICRAIELANRHGECDVLIVGRGGGSLEDLWPFNDERVARAIYASELPVVSAVGHEVDVSISDFVADVRAATPSAAAELLSPDQTALRSQLYQLQTRLGRQLNQRLQQRRERLLALRARLRHPGERLRQRAQRLDDLELRLRRSLQRRLEQRQLKLASLDKRLSLCAPQRQIQLKRQQLAQLSHQLQQQLQQQLQARQLRLRAAAGQLHTVSPLATLERGYAIVQTDAGRVVRDASEASVGMQLESRLHRGRLRSTVTEILIEKE